MYEYPYHMSQAVFLEYESISIISGATDIKNGISRVPSLVYRAFHINTNNNDDDDEFKHYYY